MGGLMETLVQFVHPHYVTNVLLGIVFYGLKTLPPFCTLLFDDCHLEMREWELLTFLGCIIVMKTRKSPSYAVYVQTACMFAKMLSTFLFMRQSLTYGCLYILACLLHLVFVPEPVYKGPDYVTFFRGPNLEHELKCDKRINWLIEFYTPWAICMCACICAQHELERDKRINWLIEFYTPWAPTCVSFSSAFAELSAKYTLDNLKFGKMDIGRFPDIAKKFQVDTSAWSKQLPTVVLFQGGKETRRRPIIDSKGKVKLKFIFCKETVERDFDLVALHHDCKQYPLHKPGRASDKNKEQEQAGGKNKEQEQAGGKNKEQEQATGKNREQEQAGGKKQEVTEKMAQDELMGSKKREQEGTELKQRCEGSDGKNGKQETASNETQAQDDSANQKSAGLEGHVKAE